MIPPIWFLEINRINVKLGRVTFNRTEGEEFKSLIEKGVISQTMLNDGTVRRISFHFVFSSDRNDFDKNLSFLSHFFIDFLHRIW